MRRREFLVIVGGTIAAAPIHVLAQQATRVARIGIIDNAPVWDHFRQGLRELGYVEGQSIAFEYRVANGKPERLVEVAGDLARLPVDVFVTYGTAAASRAAKSVTATIPIVMISVGDPVRSGLVPSFASPGGNITGLTILSPQETPKRLQLLREMSPSISRVAFLWNPNNASNLAQLEEIQSAAPKIGMQVLAVGARTLAELDSKLTTITKEHADALLMTGDPVHQLHIGMINDFLVKNRVPGMFLVRENVLAGGLMSYGASQPDLFRRGALYVHKILHGTKASELPIEQPTKFDLVINLKTAKALGIAIPPTLLARADEVIE